MQSPQLLPTAALIEALTKETLLGCPCHGQPLVPVFNAHDLASSTCADKQAK